MATGSARTRGLLCVVFVLGGCVQAPAPGASDAASATDGSTDASCAGDCEPCDAGYVCVTRGSWARVVPTCVRRCDSSSQCQAGEKCLNSGEASPDAGSVCVSSAAPAPCEHVPDYAHCDFFVPPYCRDGVTLMRPTPRFGAFCGFESVRCDGGCLDGGTCS